jgi:hypothetical protein
LYNQNIRDKIKELKADLITDIGSEKLETLLLACMTANNKAKQENISSKPGEDKNKLSPARFSDYNLVASDTSVCSDKRSSRILFEDNGSDSSIHSDNSTNMKFELRTINDQLTEDRIDEKLSTLLRSSSKRTSRESHAAGIVRREIKRSESQLGFRIYELLLYVSVFLLLTSKWILKFFYDQRIQHIYQAEVTLGKFTNILRPTGFLYKESLKAWINCQFDEPNRIKSMFDPVHLNHYRQRFSAQLAEVTTYYQPGMSSMMSFT